MLLQSLQGKAALVTGGSRGIGADISKRLAKDGAYVIINYSTNSEAAAKTVAEITGSGGGATAIQADISGMKGIKELFSGIKTALDKRGCNLDIVVNNAAFSAPHAIDDTDEATFDLYMNVLLKAPFFIIQNALPLMKDGGRIINISSWASEHPCKEYIAYTSAKAGLNSLTRSLAQAVGERGITVNTVAPGFVYTEMGAVHASDPAVLEALRNASALKRIARGGEIADVVAFFASHDSRWVTGAYVPTDGGVP
jgi:3-oxoacyl-[acyl-carrier protein] reductase